MKLRLWRRREREEDQLLRETKQRVMALEQRAAELTRGDRFTSDHLTKIFREGRRRA